MPHPDDASPVIDTEAVMERQSMAVLRLAGARDVLSAVLMGQWFPSPELCDALAELVQAAATDARAAEALAA